MRTNTSTKAFIFYFLMGLILLDFGNQIKKLSFFDYSSFDNFRSLYDNPIYSVIHTQNTGSAFGLFQNNSYPLALFGLFVLIFLTYYVYKKITFEDKLELLSITLFCAGTLGNLIERVQLGYVVDYIKLNFIDFPIFNAFDIMICVGVALYFIYAFSCAKYDKSEEKSKDEFQNISK